jgi:GNAT superfamily N-acetyltransferase
VRLPDGLTARPLTLEDAQAVTDVTVAEQLVDVGEGDTTVEDVLAEWQRPSYDLATRTLGVLDGDRLVAYADLAFPEFGYTAVQPELRGRGIGTALAGWLEALARSRGAGLLSTQVPEGGPADRLLAARGYQRRWTAWDLELPEGAEVAAQPLPPGYAVRDARPEEHETVYTVIEDAFGEWRPRGTLEDFAALVWGRPGHQPWNLRVVTGPDGAVLGATHVHLSGDAGYVARIAVRRDARGRGLAAAMLADAFALARGHGALRCYLSTDSRTGALGLYEKVGMRVTSAWVNRALTL